jgi:hypothetical protein
MIISVAGIPLLGVNLKLALAGMKTMLEYGIMKDWDEAQRAAAMRETEINRPPLGRDESIVFSVFGTHWYSKGIYNSWRAGTICITDKRLVMFRKMPAEVLFEIYYEEIKAMSLQKRDHFTGEKRKELHILFKDNEVARLHTKDIDALKKAVENILKEKGLSLEDNPVFPEKKEVAGDFLQPEEDVTHSEKMWYQLPSEADGGIRSQWKPGHLYLTNRRLCWWYDFERKLLFEIPSHQIMHVTVQNVQFGTAPVQEKSLIVLYKRGKESKVACFSSNGASLGEWVESTGGADKRK